MSTKNCAHELLKYKLIVSFRKLRFHSSWYTNRRQRNRRRQIKVDGEKNPNVSFKHQAPAVSNILFNPLNAELNPICHLLALLAHHILHVSRIRVTGHGY